MVSLFMVAAVAFFAYFDGGLSIALVMTAIVMVVMAVGSTVTAAWWLWLQFVGSEKVGGSADASSGRLSNKRIERTP